MIRVCIVLLIAVLGLGSAMLYEKAQYRIKTLDATILALQDKNKTIEVTLKEEREWAESREEVIAAMLAIGKDIKIMQDQIKAQDQASQKALKELIANDKAVRAYLSNTVPSNLGLLYERKGTTDPTKYGPSGGVPASSVQSPRKNSTKK